MKKIIMCGFWLFLALATGTTFTMDKKKKNELAPSSSSTATTVSANEGAMFTKDQQEELELRAIAYNNVHDYVSAIENNKELLAKDTELELRLLFRFLSFFKDKISIQEFFNNKQLLEKIKKDVSITSARLLEAFFGNIKTDGQKREFIRIIEDPGFMLLNEPFYSLIDGIHARDGNQVERVVKRGVEVNRRDIHGNTPLIYAVMHGAIPVIRAIKEKADFDLTDSQGQRPLQRAIAAAVIHGDSVVKELIACNAMVTGQDFEFAQQCYKKSMDAKEKATYESILDSLQHRIKQRQEKRKEIEQRLLAAKNNPAQHQQVTVSDQKKAYERTIDFSSVAKGMHVVREKDHMVVRFNATDAANELIKRMMQQHGINNFSLNKEEYDNLEILAQAWLNVLIIFPKAKADQKRYKNSQYDLLVGTISSMGETIHASLRMFFQDRGVMECDFAHADRLEVLKSKVGPQAFKVIQGIGKDIAKNGPAGLGNHPLPKNAKFINFVAALWAQDIAAVVKLIDTVDLNEYDASHNLPLFYAMTSSYVNQERATFLVKQLVEKGADIYHQNLLGIAPCLLIDPENSMLSVDKDSPEYKNMLKSALPRGIRASSAYGPVVVNALVYNGALVDESHYTLINDLYVKCTREGGISSHGKNTEGNVKEVQKIIQAAYEKNREKKQRLEEKQKQEQVAQERQAAKAARKEQARLKAFADREQEKERQRLSDEKLAQDLARRDAQRRKDEQAAAKATAHGSQEDSRHAPIQSKPKIKTRKNKYQEVASELVQKLVASSAPAQQETAGNAAKNPTASAQVKVEQTDSKKKQESTRKQNKKKNGKTSSVEPQAHKNNVSSYQLMRVMREQTEKDNQSIAAAVAMQRKAKLEAQQKELLAQQDARSGALADQLTDSVLKEIAQEHAAEKEREKALAFEKEKKMAHDLRAQEELQVMQKVFDAHRGKYPDFADPSTIYAYAFPNKPNQRSTADISAWFKNHKHVAEIGECGICNAHGFVKLNPAIIAKKKQRVIDQYKKEYRKNNPTPSLDKLFAKVPGWNIS